MSFRLLVAGAVLTANLLGGPQVTKEQHASTNATQDHSNKSQPAVPPTHVIIDPPFPTVNSQSVSTKSQSQPPEKPLPRFMRPEWVIVYITTIYVIIAGLTLASIKLQADLMKGQLIQMREAGEQATRHLWLTERPWVYPQVGIMSPLTFDESGVNLTIRIELTNSGKSPAMAVYVIAALYFTFNVERDLATERERITRQAIDAPPSWGQIVFPSARPTFVQDHRLSAPTEQVERGIRGGTICPIEIIVCVAYRSTLDENARPYTTIVYSLTQSGGMVLAPKKGVNIPLEHLALTLNPLGPDTR